MAANIKVQGDTLADILDKGIAQVGTSGNPVDDLFDRAEALANAREKMNELRVNVREALRHLSGAKLLTADQEEYLHTELFPPRSRAEEAAEDEGNDSDATETTEVAPA